jgi:predicted RNA-binding protein
VETVANLVGLDTTEATQSKTAVHENNSGALTLANMELGQITPQSKFYAIKMHWFRSKLKPNNIVIVKVDTDLQKADIFTKGLRVVKFINSQNILCGW